MTFIGHGKDLKAEQDPQTIAAQKKFCKDQIQILENRIELLKKHYEHLNQLEKQ